ncbi:MAG: carbohydrate kinase family protein [Clostridiales bacterium]|nr:carbohydrate kinase family protein [Clostridiales bacterium]
MNRYDVLTSGYVSMDRMLKIKSPAKVGYTSLISNADNTQVYYGGCSVNIACALCRLGMNAMPLIRVGRDYRDIGFARFLEENEIPTDGVTERSDDITSVCYLVQDNEGQHITLFYPGAMDGRYAAPFPDAPFLDAGMGVITVGARQDNEFFFDRCQKHGVPLAFGMKGDMDAFPPDFLRRVLGYCRLIFCNETEREAMQRLLGYDLGELLQRGGAQAIVTTLGGEGSRYESRGESGTVPVYRGVNVVDTTGSGDAYISGFLYGHAQGKTIRECCMLGAVEASFALEQAGCCTGLPDARRLWERFAAFKAQWKGAD